jgi:hypothetical protein
MRKFEVKVTGVTPYMQHRMDTQKLKDWEDKRGRIIERDGLNTDEEKTAMFHSYVTDDGFYYIPSEHFEQAFVKGGAFVKAKVGNSARSMKNIVAGMWMISPERIPFRKFDEVDTRSAVNNNVKARIITHRPKWNTWECNFTLNVDDDGLLTTSMIESIIGYAGRFQGVGSYRPEHTGKFGRFSADIKETKET